MSMVDRWSVQIFIGEHGDNITAEARLTTRDSARLRGSGTAHRGETDPPITEIGEEVAVARALVDLGHRLMGEASADVMAVTHAPPRLSPDEGWHAS